MGANPATWIRGGMLSSDIEAASIGSTNIVRPYIAEDPLNIFDGTIQQAYWRTEPDTGVYWNTLTDRKDVFFEQHENKKIVIPDMCATVSAEREDPLTVTNRLLVLIQADISVAAWSDCKVIEDHVLAAAGLFPFLAGEITLAQKESGTEEWTKIGQRRRIFQSYRAVTHLTSKKWNRYRGQRSASGTGRNVRRLIPRDKWNFSIAAGFTIEASGQYDIAALVDFDRVQAFNQTNYKKQKDQTVASQQFTFGPRSLKIECFRSQ